MVVRTALGLVSPRYGSWKLSHSCWGIACYVACFLSTAASLRACLEPACLPQGGSLLPLPTPSRGGPAVPAPLPKRSGCGAAVLPRASLTTGV